MEQTIQQRRAAYALNRIDGIKELTLEQQKEFVAYANSLPAMIHMNGLGQAMAFYKMKGKDKDKPAYEKLYELISYWLCSKDQPYAGKDNVLAGITQSDMAAYQLAQAETLVLMSWVKKFGKAFLAEE